MEKRPNALQTNANLTAPPAYGQPAAYSSYNMQPVTNVTVVRTKTNNFLGMAIFVTLCCCLPFGIVGIVYSVDSSSRFDRGDDAGTLSAASSAKNWSIAGLVCGIVFIIVYIILYATVLSTSYPSYY
ncbi:proline rich transmembrane protein 1B-like [Anneissia japonica]|uniref:proline rich transmembrane protein 1B-like n=1 Tax=Anneissia japonica TaxID=1529436 RepID=UPI00142573F3|nr:proline rich transmembrane protein 1B-like [Anneissia japonica]